MSSHELSPIQPARPRKKHQFHLQLVGKWLYILITRVLFFLGLSVVIRGLVPMFMHLKSETKLISFGGNRTLYQNQTLDAVTDRSKVVQPLLGPSQLFDISVTIWARAPVEEEVEWKKSLGRNVTSESVQRWGLQRGDGPVGSWYRNPSSYPFDPSDLSPITKWSIKDPLFNVIYSDVAFQRLQLSDIASSTVNFSILPKYLQDRKMSMSELKAAFTILPISPSPLDNIKDFSSWSHKDGIKPKRAWPFPLGSPYIGDRTILDESAELLSFVMPLVRLLDVPNPCLDFNYSDNVDWLAPSTVSKPYIISRTHLQIVEDLEIMNFALFNESHHTLKSHECGKKSEDAKGFNRHHISKPEDLQDMNYIKTCRRDYLSTGILETLFELGIPLRNGSNRTEWAYAPYMEAIEGGFGPKDFTLIPTQQSDCSNRMRPGFRGGVNKTEDLAVEALNISWHLTYSGVTLNERRIVDSFNSLMAPEKYTVPESSYHQVKAQDKVDLQNSLLGIQRQDSPHPRRRLVLTSLSAMISVIAGAFDALYWYTRSSTAYISILGTILLALANLINCELFVQSQDARSAFQLLLPPMQNDYRVFRLTDRVRPGQILSSIIQILRFFFVAFIPFQASWMLFTALRIELVWPIGSEPTLLKRTFPTLRKVRPNHIERSSERLERSGMRRRSQIAIVVALFITYHFMLPLVPNILDPLHPEPDPSILREKMLYKDIIMKQSIVDPLFVSGTLFQLVLNSASGFFAGSYKIAAILKATALILDVLHFVPWIVGSPESRGGMDAAFVVYGTMVVVAGWQAITLSRPSTDDENEDE